MSAIARTARVALLSFVVTIAVMLVASRLPGMEVPFGWWILGGLLPIVISVPITFIDSRHSLAIRKLNAELQAAYEQVKHAAETDHLTGIANRAAFDARVAALHPQLPGWFLVIDIDHFKQINDSNSHAHGDAALVAVARTLRSNVGPDDVVGRIGGEEFAIFMPAAGAEAALATAEAIRRAVAGLSVAGADGKRMNLTVSIGLTGGAGLTVANGLSVADRAMYLAKNEGRDRVAVLAEV